MMPWATPAFAGLLDRSDVRKSTPRSAKTGSACAELRRRPGWPGSPARRAEAEEQAPAKRGRARRRRRRAPGAPAASIEIDGLVIVGPSTSAGCAARSVAEDVEDEGHQEQQQAQEEEALEGGRVAGHLVAAGGERGHRAGHGLARPERVQGEQRASGRTGREGHDHRLADGPRDGQDHRRDDARDRGRDDDPDAVVRAAARRARTTPRAATSGTARIASSEMDATSGMVEDPDADAGRQQVERLGVREQRPGRRSG